jgi:hypothetical protein
MTAAAIATIATVEAATSTRWLLPDSPRRKLGPRARAGGNDGSAKESTRGGRGDWPQTPPPPRRRDRRYRDAQSRASLERVKACGGRGVERTFRITRVISASLL